MTGSIFDKTTAAFNFNTQAGNRTGAIRPKNARGNETQQRTGQLIPKTQAENAGGNESQKTHAENARGNETLRRASL